MNALALYWVFLRAVLLSFSGFATVPTIREALVLHAGVLTDAQLNDAIAISQASPGPLGLYVVVVGYFVSGMWGAAAGATALATPAFLAIPIARLIERGHAGALQGGAKGIVLASCALMVLTGVGLASQLPTTRHLAIVVIGAALVGFTKLKPFWVILVAAVLGVVMQ